MLKAEIEIEVTGTPNYILDEKKNKKKKNLPGMKALTSQSHL